jgi:RNA-directed DNA polymerase
VTTRQKSEEGVVAQGRGNTVPTAGAVPGAGAKAFPVKEAEQQLCLFTETAEASASADPDDRTADALAEAERIAAPESVNKAETAAPATMEAVTEHLREAFLQVARNRGAPGPDGQTISMVREYLEALLPTLTAALLNGRYQPGDIRRVWIPKSGGGERGLGIPNVVDRMVQEAVRGVLEPRYEPTFHASSHGFRPGRSCHTAIAEAVGYLEAGYDWVVDLDLEKFFDRVHHQRLMARLAQRVGDRRLLVLIGRMLKAGVVLPDGVVVSTDEGVPQGGPLSPLLSNIVLDELDQELSRRGHRFVRYADDCNIYVASERSGQRVMASVEAFIRKRLRLQVNAKKSAVARPEERHFLGFRLRREPEEGQVEVLLSTRSRERIDQQIRSLIPRNWGGSIAACLQRLNGYLQGWIGFFGICTLGVERDLGVLDAHIRRRLRALQLKQWKRRRTIVRKLVSLGCRAQYAWREIYAGRCSLWALSHNPAVDQTLHNAYWAGRGLFSLRGHWRERNPSVVAPRPHKRQRATARS